jgi:hypothetical protein
VRSLATLLGLKHFHGCLRFAWISGHLWPWQVLDRALDHAKHGRPVGGSIFRAGGAGISGEDHSLTVLLPSPAAPGKHGRPRWRRHKASLRPPPIDAALGGSAGRRRTRRAVVVQGDAAQGYTVPLAAAAAGDTTDAALDSTAEEDVALPQGVGGTETASSREAPLVELSLSKDGLWEGVVGAAAGPGPAEDAPAHAPQEVDATDGGAASSTVPGGESASCGEPGTDSASGVLAGCRSPNDGGAAGSQALLVPESDVPGAGDGAAVGVPDAHQQASVQEAETGEASDGHPDMLSTAAEPSEHAPELDDAEAGGGPFIGPDAHSREGSISAGLPEEECFSDAADAGDFLSNQDLSEAQDLGDEDGKVGETASGDFVAGLGEGEERTLAVIRAHVAAMHALGNSEASCTVM